jgi:hypothetical protein
LERTDGVQPGAVARPSSIYALPQQPGTITLAALTRVEPNSAVRGPGETFQTLFAAPYGPNAFANYLKVRASEPAPVYGVSNENVQRMDLVLDQLARSERGRRITEASGAIGFGGLMAGAGVGVLAHEPGLSRSDKTEARVTGGILLGVGGLIALGGAVGLFVPTESEGAAAEFRHIIRHGGDPAVAFAKADERLRLLAKERLAERYAGGFFGALFLLGSTTGLIWTELAADSDADRLYPRLGWSTGILGGVAMIGDAVFTQTPIDSLTKIWRDDPSLHQYQHKYQPGVSVSSQGASLTFTGTF